MSELNRQKASGTHTHNKETLQRQRATATPYANDFYVFRARQFSIIFFVATKNGQIFRSKLFSSETPNSGLVPYFYNKKVGDLDCIQQSFELNDKSWN